MKIIDFPPKESFAAYTVLPYSRLRWDSSTLVLFGAPHASNKIPKDYNPHDYKDYRDPSVLSHKLARHWGWDLGSRKLTHYLAKNFGGKFDIHTF